MPGNGAYCEACEHQHTGRQWAYICIGCPCPETPGRDDEGDDS